MFMVMSDLALIRLSLLFQKDADAAYQCVCDFVEPSCVIVKHTNPCGVAKRSDLLEAYRLAVSRGDLGSGVRVDA